jgi:putative acetyltransferase
MERNEPQTPEQRHEEPTNPELGKNVRVRPESPADYDVIDGLVQRAFNDAPTAELVRLIRESPNYIPELSLVATEGTKVLGHIMLHHLNLDDGRETHQVVSLSPVAVFPEVQKRGIGSALIRAGVEKADAMGEPLIVLEGSPAYYPRFGFAPAKGFGVSIDLPRWAPEEAAMVSPLSHYDSRVRGKVIYPPAFDRVNQDR